MPSEGIVVKFIADKGFGFIRSQEYSEDIYFHINDVLNTKSVSVGQSLSFDMKNTKKGPAAVSIKAGKKQKSPYLIFFIASGLITGVLYFLFLQKLEKIPSYVLSISLCTFFLYGYDKFVAGSSKTRVPEIILHTLVFLGGTIGGFVAQNFFRHKTIKGSFQIVFWAIAIIQVALIFYLNK